MSTKKIKKLMETCQVELNDENYPVLSADGKATLSRKVAARIKRRISKIKALESKVNQETAALNYELSNLLEIQQNAMVMITWAIILQEVKLSRVSWKDVAIQFLGEEKVAEIEQGPRNEELWYKFDIEGAVLSRKATSLEVKNAG